jgi:hypothetical protein
MNAVIMQHSSDLERTLLQQQQELNELALSLQKYSVVSSGVGTASESACIDVGTLAGRPGNTSGMNSLTNLHSFPANPNTSFHQTECFASTVPDVVERYYPPTRELLQQDFSLSLQGESLTKGSGVKQTTANKKMRLSETPYYSDPLVDVNQSLVASASQIYPRLQYVIPGEQGQDFYGENDVLSGRGGGTNVHLGNRYFRDLINLYRRSYLKCHFASDPYQGRKVLEEMRNDRSVV